MSLEESMSKLAAAMDRYSDTIEKYGDRLLTSLGEADAKAETKAEAPKAEDKPKGKPGRPKKETPKAEGNDGMGDDEDEETGAAEEALDFDTVKAKLLEVRDVFGDKSHALAIIKKHGGYAALTEIQEKDFRKIYDAAVAKLATKSDDDL